MNGFRDVFPEMLIPLLTGRSEKHCATRSRASLHANGLYTHSTNNAEGYHRGLSALHQDIRQRVKQLERGAPPTVRRPGYVQNDANLQMAKDTLEQWLQNVHEPAPDENILRDHLLRHLDRVQHLIG